MKKAILAIIIMAAVVLEMGYLASAANDPIGPTNLTRESSQRLNESNYPPLTIEAEAGNLTEITITANSQTLHWQGYYGNISGTIVLDDVNNNTFYDWSSAEPKGEIFASTASAITWANIHCFEFNSDGLIDTNLSQQEVIYSMDAQDDDGIDETFNDSTTAVLTVGNVDVQPGCPTTWVFQNDARQQENFQNILLSDNSSLVFTAIIENNETNNDTDIPGFNGNLYDFQLLVAENGVGAAQVAATTTYYFWVEIE